MSFLLNLTRQTGAILGQQSLLRRMILLAIMVGSVCGMVWLTLHARTGGYVVLYSGLEPAEAGRATAKLLQLGIAAEPDNGGTTVKVPRNRADEAAIMLAQEEIPSTGGVGFELLDQTPIGQSKFQQEKNYLRMREGELARTLQSINGIERAKVHLAIPEGTVFLKDTEAPTASVTLRLRRGTVLDDRQLRGITFLVSRSVEGMRPEDVSLIDDKGNLLNTVSEGEAGPFSPNFATFRAEEEAELKQNIETMLEKIVGRGRVVARVQAEYDFATLHEMKEHYNPDEQDPILSHESVTRESQPGRSGTLQAGAGSDTNLPETPDEAVPGEAAAGSLRENTQSDYLVSKVVQESEDRAPKLERLSVAVLVDGNYEEVTGENGEVTREFRERSADELKQFEDLVKSAIGFTQTDERTDVVSIQCAPFTFDSVELLEEPFLNYEMQRLIEQVIQWAVVALMGLLVVFFVLRPALKQVMVSPIAIGPQALPAGAGGMAALTAGAEGKVEGMMGHQELDRLREKLQADKSLSEEARQEMLQALQNDPEVAQAAKRLLEGGRGEHNHVAELQKLASKYVRQSAAEAQGIHREVMDVARQNPQKAVSLIRQWMDEA